MFTLTQNEREIMDLLWREKSAFTRTAIIEALPDKSWSNNSIHILLNNLIEKGAINVEGYVKTTKNYGRTYAAAITPVDYALMQLKKNLTVDNNGIVLADVFNALLKEEEVDAETIAELEEMLSEKKKELKE